MQIQKRWPVIFAVGSVLAYVTNNYTIGGLEHLRLQPRQSTNLPANYGNGNFDAQSSVGFPGTLFPGGGFPGGFRDPGQELFNSAVGAIEKDAGKWAEKLGVGEKLAVIQDQLSNKINDISRGSNSGFSTGLNAGPNTGLGSGLGSGVSSGLPSTLPMAMSFGDLPGQSSKDARLPSSSLLASNQNLANQNVAKPIPTNNPLLISKPIMDSVPAIRIASFNANSLGAAQMAKSPVVETLVAILRQFDVVALQGIQSERDDILPILVERINQAGRRFDYLIGPRVGVAGQTQQFAFLFDTTKLETDRYQLYTIDDPENLMTFDPLVGWFRCKESKADDAFTFSLINLRVNRSAANNESALIPNLFHAVAGDGRNEDDLILAGDFGCNPTQIAKLNSDAIRFAIRDVPTEVTGQTMQDCVLFPTQGTTEFSGRSGVFDFLRKYNLSIEQAMELSSHMPVWAEFYAAEGAHPGRVAPVSSTQVFQ